MKTNCVVKVNYKVGNNEKEIYLGKTTENEDAKYVLEKNSNVLKFDIQPNKKIELVKIMAKFNYKFKSEDKIYVNGYQSWTDSREFGLDERLHSLNKVPSSIVKKYALDSYGDYRFKKYTDKKGVFHSFSYGYVRRQRSFDFIGSLAEDTGYTIINYYTPKNGIILEKDCAGIQTDESISIFDVCFLEGSVDEVFDRYFELLNIAKPKVKPMSGYTSWYNHYQNINQDIINKNLDAIINSKHKFEVFQIDDGYQTAVGDWLSIDREKFPSGLKGIVQKAKKNNLVPGLWLAPFVCETTSRIFKSHKDWILKDEKGQMVKAGNNWSHFYTLDIYNSEVREYIKKCLHIVLNDWGFEMVKLDFLYAVSIVPSHNKSRGQIMYEAMDFIRECVGDKLILGCGVPLAPSFGKVDFCRIGCDVGLKFDENFIMRRLHRERVSTKNSIYNAIYRRHLNNRAFLNDPDVFLLRDDNIKLSKKQKENLALINALLGSLLFTSDDISHYDTEKEALLNKAFIDLEAEVIDVKEIDMGIFNIEYCIGGIRNSICINIFDK